MGGNGIAVFGEATSSMFGTHIGVQGNAVDGASYGGSYYGVLGIAPIQTCSTVGGVSTCSGAAGYFNGDLFSTAGVWSNSDQMFKDQVVSVTNAKAILATLNCKQYVFKQQNFPEFNFSTGQHYGFIAQEVEATNPSFVKDFTNPAKLDSTGAVIYSSVNFKAVNYVELIPLLVEALKEQQAQIDSLIAASPITPIAPGTNPQRISPSQKIELSNNQGIILNQNDPNPFSESTRITYFIPDEVKEAKIMFTDNKGTVLRSAKIESRGQGSLEVYASELSSGIYTYTLVCDGKAIESKRMMKTE